MYDTGQSDLGYSMAMFQEFEHLETVSSTSEHLKSFVAKGVPRITMADEQTAGKGRYGRSWHSEKGQGLYVSFLVYPTWTADRAPFLTMIAALAVIRAIQSKNTGTVELRIKVPNDVRIRRKKVAGILTELSTQSDRIRWGIIGIGVNLYHQKFPEELELKATSLLLEGLRVDHSMALCQEIARQLEEVFRLLERDQWRRVRQEFQTFLEEENEPV